MKKFFEKLDAEYVIVYLWFAYFLSIIAYSAFEQFR